MKENLQNGPILRVPSYIQRSNIELRRGTEVQQISPEELEKRYGFKWREDFIYAEPALPAEIIEAGRSILNLIPTLDDKTELRKFQEQLIQPDSVFLCDMGPGIGLALGAKQTLKQGSLLPFSGCWQTSSREDFFPDNDYSYLVFDHRKEGGKAYLVNPKARGNLARYIPHMATSALAEQPSAERKDSTLPLNYQGIEVGEIATANMVMRLYTLTEDGQQHLLPVLVLNRDLHANELFGYPYAGIEYWAYNSIQYPSLFFKQPRQDGTYIVPTQYWKRSYALKERLFVPITIFETLRQSNDILYYLQPMPNTPFIDLRRLFIESNAVAAEQWGPQPNGQLAQAWQATMEADFITDKKGAVETYWQDPGATIPKDKEKQDMMIILPDKKAYDSFIAAYELIKATLTAEQQVKIRKEKLISIHQVESHYSVLLRNQQENSALYKVLQQNYYKLSIYAEWAAQPALQQKEFIRQWQKICSGRAELVAYWGKAGRFALNERGQLRTDSGTIDIKITLEAEEFQDLCALLKQATADLEQDPRYGGGSKPTVSYDSNSIPAVIILPKVNYYSGYYEALLRRCQTLETQTVLSRSGFNLFPVPPLPVRRTNAASVFVKR